MAKKTLRNTPASESDEMAEAGLPAIPPEAEADLDGKSRRDAMMVLAKHAAYTAPAVLTILSLTTSRAKAFSF